MKITFLGTGTSQGVPVIGGDASGIDLDNPKNWRTRSSVHVECGGIHIQIDAGPEFRVQCLKNKIDWIDCFILTHGHADHIAGICDLQYIKLEKVRKACLEGRVADCGNGMNPNIERIIDLHPDALLISPFENSGGYGRVEKLGIPIIECADYMESSPLGRAEWMRFYGLLTGTASQADSLFNQVEQTYLSLSRLAQNEPDRPTVLGELKNGAAWYVPGGQSTTGQLFEDAGSHYVFASLKQSGSVPLSFETVFNKGEHADFWFIKYNQAIDKTYGELRRDYAPYSHFDAFKNRRIFGCNTNRVPFYEETPYHPERILKDLIKILHPKLLEGYSTQYFTNLAE